MRRFFDKVMESLLILEPGGLELFPVRLVRDPDRSAHVSSSPTCNAAEGWIAPCLVHCPLPYPLSVVRADLDVALGPRCLERPRLADVFAVETMQHDVVRIRLAIAIQYVTSRPAPEPPQVTLIVVDEDPPRFGIMT